MGVCGRALALFHARPLSIERLCYIGVMSKASLNYLDEDKFWAPKVMGDSQYREHWPLLRSFMSKSRDLRTQPAELLDLQADMASALIGAQESQRRLKGQLSDQYSSDAAPPEDVQQAIRVSKRLAHVVKQIGDGMAWRTLHYNRAIIDQLSMKPQTGHLDLESTAEEFAAAEESLKRTAGLVIVNGLTNVLRYGDYTLVHADGHVDIVEVKGGKGSKRSGHTKTQRRELGKVVDFITQGIGLRLARPSAIFSHRRELKSHLPVVGELIREARVSGSAHARLSDCLAVDVLFTDMMVAEDRQPIMHNPFMQSNEGRTYHSLQFFDRFAKNVAPYSIFPFSDEDCSDIMTGAILLISHFNYGNLVRCLRRRGLSVESPTKSQTAAYAELSLGEMQRHQDDVALRVSRAGDPRVLFLRQALLGRHLYEFLDEESFADAAEEMFDRTGIEGVGVAFSPSFRNEKDLWD